MVSGFIASVQGHIIADKFVVSVKVRHSWRVNGSLIRIWIITERAGTIFSVHCQGWKAGQAESCLQIASVIFSLEAWTEINHWCCRLLRPILVANEVIDRKNSMQYGDLLSKQANHSPNISVHICNSSCFFHIHLIPVDLFPVERLELQAEFV